MKNFLHLSLLLFFISSNYLAAQTSTEPKLKLTSMCSDTEEVLRWRVRNPFSTPIKVTWNVHSTNQTGEYYAESGDTYFFTDKVSGPNTTIISWTDSNGDSRQTVKASGFAICNPPVEKLKLTSMCYDVDDERRWRVRNPNNFPVEVTWEVYSGKQTGGYVAAPGDTYFITNDFGGANTTKLYWTDENGNPKSTVKASGNARCTPALDCTPAGINGGVIAYDGASIIESLTDASATSGNAQIEYVWMMSFVDVPNVVGNSDWQAIPNTNQKDLDITSLNLTQTTYFIRCARIVGCDEPYWGETERVVVEVLDCSPQGINGGEVAFSGVFNAETNNTIENVSAATPTFGNDQLEYMWMMSTEDVPNTVGNPHWQAIPASKDMLELDVTFLNLTETTYFIRCARIVGCDEPYWGETERVVVEVLDCSPQGIAGGSIYFKGEYDVDNNNTINSISPAKAIYGDTPVEYIWMMSTKDVPNPVGNTDWQAIENTNQESLDLTSLNLTETTYFIRCARLIGCDEPYWGETERVVVEVLEEVPVVADLKLTSMCYDDENQRRWRVRNPNNFAIDATWEVYGTSQTGTIKVVPGDNFFLTDNVGGSNTTKLYWLDENDVQQETVKASGNARCTPPVVADLKLTSMCYDDENQRRWRVRNPNSFAIDATWEVYGTNQTGTISVAPGDNFFLTDNVGGSNTTKLYWLDENDVQQETVKASGNARCTEETTAEELPTETTFSNSKALIYPMPANNEINLTFDNSDYTEANFRILGMDGSAILNETDSLEMGENKVSIPVENLPNGIYLIQVIRGNTVETQRVIIQH